MALSGTINGSVTQLSGTFSFYLTWSAVQNIAGNYSDVTVKTYWSTNNTYSEFDTVGARSASITINGETTSISKVFAVYWRTLGASTYLIQTATKRVYHNSDGSKSITISARANGHAASYGPSSSVASSGDCTASGTITLNSIPRATTPTFSATTQTMGSAITITLAPASTGFKHKIRYSFGTLSNQTSGLSIGSDFSAAGNTTVTFTPPTSLANQIPNANSGLCSIYCYTYNSGGTQIGSVVVKTITLNVPSYTPTASVALTGNNLLSSTYVKGKSTVTAKITAASSYGATITSYSSVVDGSTYTGQTFTSKVLSNGSKTVKTTVKDSRGKSVTVDSAAFTVYDYAAPTITEFTLARQSNGTTVIATLKGTVASVNSKNAKTFQVTLNGVTQSITSTSYTLNGTTTFTNVPTDNTLVATAKITDSYTSVTKEAVLPTVAVTMDFHKDGDGIAMGKVSETRKLLDVAWPIKSKGIKSQRGPRPASANIAPESDYFGTLEYYLVSNSMTGGGRPMEVDGQASSTHDGHLLHFHWDNNGGWDSQLFIKNSTGSLLTRGCNAGTWGAWKQMLDLSICKDYVVEQSTSGDWYYTKWNSGKCEAWRKVTIGNVTLTTSMTTGVWSNDTQKARDISLPSGLFADAPYAFSNATSSGYTITQVSNTTKDTISYRLWAPYSATIANCIVFLYVIGKWK